MEKSDSPATEQAAGRQIVVTYQASELRPDTASVAWCQARFAEEEPADRRTNCLGWLIVSVEGIANQLERGNAFGIAREVRLGLAAIAAYEQYRNGGPADVSTA